MHKLRVWNLPYKDMDKEKPTEPQTGADIIAAYVKTLPGKPGVYRMIDEHGELLYIGKAKHLKKTGDGLYQI